MSFEEVVKQGGGGKVFCIGMHKTGTKSLAMALEQLGYRVHGPAWTRDIVACASLESLWRCAGSVIHAYDAFQDNPWPMLWPYLWKSFPRARFILTVREEETWLTSMLGYFGSNNTPMRKLQYGQDAGSPLGNEQTYLRHYRSHAMAVQSAMKGCPRFLCMNIGQGHGWEELCGFLGREIPARSFPHVNRSMRGDVGTGSERKTMRDG